MQIIQQTAALADHDQQSPAGAVVFDVFLQVLGQVVDALGQQRDLDVGRTGIPLVQFEIRDHLRFCFHNLSTVQSSFLLQGSDFTGSERGCKAFSAGGLVGQIGGNRRLEVPPFAGWGKLNWLYFGLHPSQDEFQQP